MPEITDAMLDRAEVRIGDRVVRRGRPPPLSEARKTSVTLRLDLDVLKTYRESGAGWQSRLNDDLRRVKRLAKRR